MSDLSSKVLVVEDEKAVVTLLKYNLEREGYQVDTVGDGREALLAIEENPPDIILLDWMLPELSGIEVCRQLRNRKSHADIPIIMLTARSEEADTVRALEVGVDDYISKPFSSAELTARVKATLRRARKFDMREELNVGSLHMNIATHRVYRFGEEIKLGPIEYKLLRYFMENPGRIFSREKLLDKVWGRDVYVELRTVDVHIRRLRRAINISGHKDIVRTVRSAGYGLENDQIN